MKKLRIKKVTLRDLDESTLNNFAGASAQLCSVGYCNFSSNEPQGCPTRSTCVETCLTCQ
jgi:hypothetical protein